MDKDKYKKLASNPKMISGIHNYCNKCFERCKFTTRCAVGVLEDFPKDYDGSAKFALISWGIP